MRVAMLGLGLIGGSIARALARPTVAAAWHIAAWTPSGVGPRAALAEGTVSIASPSGPEALHDAEIVLLAASPTASLALLDELAGPWSSALRADAVISDVSSTKVAITLRAAALGLRFVGGHPMAGTDRSGYAASRADLFDDRPWVIVPSGDGSRDERVQRLARACGAVPVTMAAAEHDRAVAGISHLPLVAASALVESVVGGPEGVLDDWPAAARLAAGGWRDMTRLARGDVAMGTGIAVTNAGPLAARLRRYIEVLEGWAADLEAEGSPDTDGVEARLRLARHRLEEGTP